MKEFSLHRSQSVRKTFLQHIDWLCPHADAKQPARHAALFNKIQFCVMRENRIRAAQREVRAQIRPFADLQIVKHLRSRRRRLLQYDL